MGKGSGIVPPAGVPPCRSLSGGRPAFLSHLRAVQQTALHPPAWPLCAEGRVCGEALRLPGGLPAGRPTFSAVTSS